MAVEREPGWYSGYQEGLSPPKCQGYAFGYFSNSLKDQNRCLSLFWPPQATATSLGTVTRRYEETHIFVLLGISGTDI